MKKILSILLVYVLLIQSIGTVSAEIGLLLSDTTRISSGTNTCYAEASFDEVYDGEYSLHFYTEGDWLEISQDYKQTLEAGTYTLTWYAKGTGKIWFYSNWGTEWAATHSVDVTEDAGNGWTKYTRTLQIDGNGDTSFLFHGDGAVDQYIDNVSLVDENGINYIKDGGFEEVTIVGGVPPQEDIPDEDLTLSSTTRVSMDADNCYARVTDDYKNSGNYSLHFYTEGDWLEIAQNYTASLPAGIYKVTWYAKGTGKIWFYSNWGTEWAATHAVDSAEPQINGWTKYTRTLQIDGNGDTLFLFHNDGAVDQYIDDISLTDENGTNYIIDGGFEEVTVEETVAPPSFEEYETIILASSDFQNTTSSEAGSQTVAGIIDAIEEDGLIGADAFFCCGDYANTYNETEENLNILKETVSDFVPDADSHVYVQGNHDAAIGTQGLAQSGNNDPENGEYGVFVINEDDYMWNNSDLARIKDTAENLADYLNEKLEEDYDKPIFVLSHLPLYKSLRTTNDGDAQHANQLFHVLNQAGEQGLNIIFMSGHDHSSGYESYLGGSSVYLAKGDRINIPQGSKTAFRAETLNFTYMNAGYIGYCNSSADSTLTMTLFGIDEDTDSVDVFRYDRRGLHNLKSAGVLKPEEVTAGEYQADTTVYTSPQNIELTQVNYEYEIKTLDESSDPTPTPTPGTQGVPDDYLTLSGTTVVNVQNTDTCYAKVTDDEKATGSYSLHIKAGAEDWLEVSQNLTETATAGGTYLLSASVKAVSGKVWFRVGWDDTGWLVSTQTDLGTDLGDGWVKITKEVSLTADQTKLLFHNDGASELYIDDISLVPVGGTENLVPDGGFEEVDVYTPDMDDFEDYELSNLVLKKGTAAIDSIQGAGTYTVSVSAKNNKLEDGLPCELLVAVFDQNGVMENLYSDKELFEMTALGAEADTLSVTFNIAGDGYSVEAYLINDRQNVELYTIDGEYILELWTQSVE